MFCCWCMYLIIIIYPIIVFLVDLALIVDLVLVINWFWFEFHFPTTMKLRFGTGWRTIFVLFLDTTGEAPLKGAFAKAAPVNFYLGL